jgi:hypothetical protein
MTDRRACVVAASIAAGVLLAAEAHAQCAVVNPAVPPAMTLNTGASELYFRENGVQSLLLGRNPTGWDTDGSAGVNTQHFDELFGYAAAGGERIMRIQVVTGARPNPLVAGDVDCNWVVFWDEVLTRAATSGLHVLPVFGVHAQWRAALPNWATNEYNVANNKTCLDGTQNCLTANPGDLLLATPTRDAWIAWVRTVVARWKERPNIVGWEIFSEVDLVDGATDGDAAAFIEAAALEIRAEDPNRPVTASTSGTIDWPGVHGSSIDFMEVHPYSSTFGPGNLDEMILTFVRQRLQNYPAKPLLIGESGLHYLAPDDPGNPYTLAEPGVRTGVRQAIWAGAVSGAMNARSLWWEDGYDRFHIDDLCVGYPQYGGYPECTDGDATTKLTLRALYASAAAPVAAFVLGVDYAGFAPIALNTGPNLYGAALGGTNLVLGWVKDVTSVASTNWTAAGTLSGETVTLDVPGSSPDWLVDIYDTTSGTIVQTIDADQDPAAGDDLTFTLDVTGSVAFKAYPVGPLSVTIDVIPSGTLNRINMTAPNPITVPVAILGTAGFDVTTVEVASVRFGPGAAAPLTWSFTDVNGDGFQDLRLRFLKSATGFTCRGVQDGVLTGETVTGRSITGTDTVRVRGAGLPPC